MLLLFFAPVFVVFGFAADYLWNLIVLSSTRSLIGRFSPLQRAKNSLKYCLMVTLVGLAIDLIYYFCIAVPIVNYLTLPLWATRLLAGVSLLVPITLIGFANFFMSQWYSGLTRRQAWVMGISMGVFTTPYMLIAWWP